MDNDPITEEEFRERIKAKFDGLGHGAQTELAHDIGVSPQYINDILRGRRSISDALARKFGRRLVKLYVIPDSMEAS